VRKGAGAGPPQTGPPRLTFRLGITEPTAIDPYRAQETEGILVTKALFVGLVGVDEQGRLVPGVARSWSASEDCTTWVFQLVPDTRFSNGEPVTAEAFIRGWSRAASREGGSEVAYHLAGVEGFQEVQAGRTDALSGVSARTPYTLVVRLSEPDCEFDKKTLQPVMSPTPSVAEGATNRAFNDLPIGNGPFELAGPWRHGQGITLTRNEGYAGPRASLHDVEIAILDPEQGVEYEYEEFKSGRLDYARVPPNRLHEAKDLFGPDGAFVQEDKCGVTYLLPMLTAEPLNSPEARKAISYAISRDALIQRFFAGCLTKATSLLPPMFADAYQSGVCESCVEHDPEMARSLGGRAGLLPGTALDMSYNMGAGHDGWVQDIAGQLRETLGLVVRVDRMTASQLVESRTSARARGLYRAAWVADYPTPDNFLFPLLCSEAINPDDEGRAHGDNEGRYANPAFDSRLRRARAARTDAERAALFGEAERIAIGGDMALIPLWYRTLHRVFDARRFGHLSLDFFGNPTLSRITVNAPSVEGSEANSPAGL
jgi:oligopeptide transport system substrate-binding protein